MTSLDYDQLVQSLCAQSHGAPGDVEQTGCVLRRTPGIRHSGSWLRLRQIAAAAQAHGRGLHRSDGRDSVGEASKRALACALQGRAEQLPFGADRFDLIFSVDVIHHIGDCAAYFRETYGRCAPADEFAR